ncbi:Uncharacterized protein dnl_20080 [Desulfonema limicola]|uniref:Uncharacterized protein n=1 Tax=Desulfonema limicola TaxID=45656 RepID=A0A975B6M1_9BACT|nr:Uncharacterized protein dnl_20080 [Desulfonema limicola]
MVQGYSRAFINPWFKPLLTRQEQIFSNMVIYSRSCFFLLHKPV